MNNIPSPDLTPGGQRRRDEILRNVLVASSSRQRRKRHIRAAAVVAALVLLALGIPYAIYLSGTQQFADDTRPLAPKPLLPQSTDPQPLPEPSMVIVETLTDEMLIAQLDEAQLPYLLTGEGEVRLIDTGYDPWIFETSDSVP